MKGGNKSICIYNTILSVYNLTKKLILRAKFLSLYLKIGESTLYPSHVSTYWQFDAQCLKIGR
jgi:hypothetical protein